MTQAIIILVCICLVAIGAFAFMVLLNKNKQKELKRALADIEGYKKNLEELKRYDQKASELKDQGKEIEKKIIKASTKKEVKVIMKDLVGILNK